MSTKIHWIIERGVVEAETTRGMTGRLREEGVDYSIVRVIPFLHEIEGEPPAIEPGHAVICYGSVGLQTVCDRLGWSPGYWSGGALDETALMAVFGSLYLNNDAFICRFEELEPGRLFPTSFIKPNRDTKIFAGDVVTREAFSDWRTTLLRAGLVEPSVMDAEILVAPAKGIGCEWRFFIVGGQVAAACCYRQHQRVMPDRWVPPAVRAFVADCVSTYNPLPAYALDVAQVADGSYRVLEMNTMNNAGFYACDPAAVVSAVNEMLRAMDG